MVPFSPTAMKIFFPKVTPKILFVVPEVLLSQVVPLSDEERIVPLSPTAMKVLFPKVTSERLSVVPEDLEIQEDPLSSLEEQQADPMTEVRMVPLSPAIK